MRSKSRHFTFYGAHRFTFAPRFLECGLLLLDSSPDPKLVFLDNGKLSMEINLTEPVEPFCKNRPNICFGWRSRSQPNDSRRTP